MSLPPLPSEIRARLQEVRALILDVDGVLTDGRTTYISGGLESKTFHARDGFGIQLMMDFGYLVGVVSGLVSEVTEARCDELNIRFQRFGISGKLEGFQDMLVDMGVAAEEVAYIGDDLPDLPIFAEVGVSIAVADAAPELRSRAHIVLRNNGGQGAVREACEQILKAKGQWEME